MNYVKFVDAIYDKTLSLSDMNWDAENYLSEETLTDEFYDALLRRHINVQLGPVQEKLLKQASSGSKNILDTYDTYKLMLKRQPTDEELLAKIVSETQVTPQTNIKELVESLSDKYNHIIYKHSFVTRLRAALMMKAHNLTEVQFNLIENFAYDEDITDGVDGVINFLRKFGAIN